MSLIEEVGIRAVIANDLASFGSALGDDTAVGLLAEEAVRFGDLKQISNWIGGQPSWSDLPFIVLTQRGGGPERNPAAARLSEVLSNVTFLERPFHATSFISVVRTALKGRMRQFEARTRIEAISDGERRLQTALSAGHLGSWELDLASMTLSTSKTCKAVFGRMEDDPFTYDDLLVSVHPDDLADMQSSVSETVSSGVDCSIEYRTIWPNGTVHWAEIHAQLYRDRSGDAKKLVGVAVDTTERKLAQQALEHLNETLEQRVQERTAEVQAAHAILLEEVAQRERAEEQLRQSQKMEAIGQLTGGVAHDFNNLLMAVLGNLELLEKHVSVDPKAARLVDGAIQGARRGASLTQRLLAFARQQDLQARPVDMQQLVDGMRDLLSRSVGSTIDVSIDLGNLISPALVDGNQVELALLNLVVNARDAMPDGGRISISLSLQETTELAEDLSPGSYVVLSVADTGTGMSTETLAKAIDPFFSTKELGKGTGLGLSMIHGLALQLKGALRLCSRLGDGTTAELWLPSTYRKVEQVAEPDAVVIETPRLRILLVDDDTLIAMSSVDMLEDLGHDVLEANSGKDALVIIESDEHIDLMITDFSMPGMTGAQLAVAARQKRPDMPIIVATGYADLPGGIDLPRLSKPYTQDQLSREIAKILNRI